PEAVADGLAGVLRHHTDTPGQCYFAIWDGHAGLRPRQGFGATFASHDRRWYLYTAPVAAADEQFEDISGIAPIPPNLWWPEDKRWCVATEIDCASTYIGCDEAAAEALTRSSLDMIRVNPADHIS
ncbi:MAG: hypothetical protein ACRDN9_21925, partial [Streptosporangiaceae bacterium]